MKNGSSSNFLSNSTTTQHYTPLSQTVSCSVFICSNMNSDVCGNKHCIDLEYVSAHCSHICLNTSIRTHVLISLARLSRGRERVCLARLLMRRRRNRGGGVLGAAAPPIFYSLFHSPPNVGGHRWCMHRRAWVTN